MRPEEAAEFEGLKPVLAQAKYGSYLILPLKYDKGEVNEDWLERECRRCRMTTMDLTEPVKELFHSGQSAEVGACYMMDRDALLRGMFGGEEGLHGFTVSHEAEQERLDFDFHSAYLYLFHTQVAFLCLGLRFSRIRTLRQICSPGSAENHACYHCLDSRGQEREFSLNLQLTALCARAGLRGFFPSSPSLLLEEYIYSVAVVPQRFPSLESMRQAAFNLHMLSPVESMTQDDSEEDVRYVYAVKNQELGGTYRWGCCVSSQTISYVVADREMDIDGEMVTQAQDGLPMILVALYEKYTCLRFTELLTLTDKKRMKRLRALKKLMLEFRAYGTVDPANISRWHNVKRIYQYVIETNGVPSAVEDVNNKLSILVEHQRELEAARNDTVAWVLTLFGIVSILASILSIIQILSGGNPLEWFVTIMSSLLIMLLVAIVVIMRKKDE